MNRLRECRKKVHMDVAYLADQAGISVRHLQFIESGKRTPSLLVAKKIADCLGNSIESLFFYMDGENENSETM